MANIRIFLLISLAFVGMLLYQQWQVDYGPKPQVVENTTNQTTSVETDAGPDLEVSDQPTLDTPDNSTSMDADTPTLEGQANASVAAAIDEDDDVVTVTTDVLELKISQRGGALVQARLLNYPVALKTPEQKVHLFSLESNRLYTASSGLVATSDAPNHTALYETAADSYTLQPGQETLQVPLTWRGANGVEVTKVFTFAPNSYEIQVDHQVTNQSGTDWQGAQYQQFLRVPPPKPEGSFFGSPQSFSFNGIARRTEEEKYEKFDFDEAGEFNTVSSESAWIAMVEHYFIGAWLPPADQNFQLSAQQLGDNQYRLRSRGPTITVAAGATHEFNSRLYVGPKLQDHMEEIAPQLELTVDYGIFTPFSKILFWLLDLIHGFVGNWGWAIVLLTVLVKLAFFKLTEAQYKSMAKMRKLQPRITAMKERYGDDKQKFNLAMMDLYKKEKVNPFGGCLPLLIQIPVFIALYWVLVESVELRQAPFILWINDLSSKDPYFILPAINAAAMFMTAKLSPNPSMDPVQQKIMLFMPVAFSVMFAFFQAGLVLYWAVNASLSLLQQWVITKRIEAQDG